MHAPSSRLAAPGILFLFLLLVVPIADSVRAQSDGDYDHGSIGYSKTNPTDPVARLQQRIDSGEVTLKSESDLGYLPAILRELNVPPPGALDGNAPVIYQAGFRFARD